MQLFCFPYAGAGGSFYRSWSAYLPETIEIYPVQLPGRESRIREAPHTHLNSLIDALVTELGRFLRPPYAFFGHSLGALVAFELVRRLQQTRYQQPVHLFVSGRIAPQLQDPRPPMHTLPTTQLLDSVNALGGTSEVVLASPELINLLLPLLRADLMVNETYRYTHDEPLSIPLTAFGGLADPKVSRAEIEAWGAQTRAAFRLQMFSGDHFFISTATPLLLEHVALELRPWLHTQ